jgi:glycosyltransferase involved in cell wall biosynthesis
VRVVFLTHNFPRHPGDLSGAFLATLARALGDRGIEVVVVAPSDQGETGPPAFEGIPVRRVRYGGPAQETLAYRGTMAESARSPAGWVGLARLRRALGNAASEELSRGADLVHAHWWVPGGISAPRGARMVLTVHGTDVAILQRSSLARMVARPVFRRARVVTAVSGYLGGVLMRTVGRGADAGHVSPMPLDTSRYTRWSDGGAGVVVLARLMAQKRLDLVLHALALTAQGGRGLRLTVIGDGPERGRLEAMAQQLALGEGVRFIGRVAPAEVPDLLRGMDAMIFPAAGEGFGLGAAEALMSGVPVVACHDGGGVLDIVPATGAGRLSDPEPRALAAALLELLADPGARPAAREAGAAWRERLSPAAVAARCEAWYREALGD